MQEEIKKILDYLKIENGTIGSELSYEETHLLLDYITNLQENYERIYNENCKLREENEMLKLEIERLNDVLVHKPDEKITLKTNDGQELFIIQSERIDMQEEHNTTFIEWQKDIKANKKAIEYIKEKQELTDIDEIINTTELLNILQGVDKE